MISLDDCSTFAARSFTASATTAKPAPASPARLASTVALNATSRVCSAICVMSVAAAATSRSDVTTPRTPSPTCATASRAWPIAARPASPLASIARLDAVIACMSAASCPISATWRLPEVTTSSIVPSSSAAPRPSSEALPAMSRIAPVKSGPDCNVGMTAGGGGGRRWNMRSPGFAGWVRPRASRGCGPVCKGCTPPARRNPGSLSRGRQSWRRTLGVTNAVAPTTNSANDTQNATPTGPWFRTSGNDAPDASSSPTTTNGIR